MTRLLKNGVNNFSLKAMRKIFEFEVNDQLIIP